MNPNDINSIIDNLSTKFGVASQYLITEISKYKIARGIAFIIVFLILAITSGIVVYIVRKAWKRDKKEYEEYYHYRFDEDLYIWAFGSFMFLCIIFMITVFINIVEIAGYIGSPTGAVVDYILQQVH